MRLYTVSIRIFGIAVLLAATPFLPAQNILGSNLIVNGGAESGPASSDLNSKAVSIPGWTLTGDSLVLPYNVTGLLQGSDPSPSDHGFQYFVGGSGTSTLTQDIDLAAAAAAVNSGTVKFSLTGFLGYVDSSSSTANGNAQLAIAFKNSNNQIFSTFVLGPEPVAKTLSIDFLWRQQKIGIVPVGTSRVTVTVTLVTAGFTHGAADNLSLVLSNLGSSPTAVLGPNLVSNPGGEEGPAVPPTLTSAYIPGWSTTYQTSVAPYGSTGWIGVNDPGPPNRGAAVFHGWSIGNAPTSTMYQDLDVSAAASLIDASKVTYVVSAWLGGISGRTTPTLTYSFFDWSGKQLGPTGQLGPITHFGTSLVSTSHSELLPSGTRLVNLSIAFPDGNALADNISFSLTPAGSPLIPTSGIVPLNSSSNTIQPGSWISIYGTNLATDINIWNGDFPTSLGGVSVSINSKLAYLWYVSPNQVNVQAPDDTATGPVNVTLTNANGTATSTVTLGQFGPSFNLYSNPKYPIAYVQTPGTPGNSGDGRDFIGPSEALSIVTRAVKAGETIVLFGVGFGPTNPSVPAGQGYAGSAPCITTPVVTIGGVPATVTYAGLIGAGLYQLNVVIPSAGSGDRLLQASVGGMTTPANIYLTLQ